jgi:F-type H+-transporting ATPase subunit b
VRRFAAPPTAEVGMKNVRWAALASVLWAVPAAAQGTSANPLTIDGGLVLWTLFVFGLLLFLLKRSAWPVLLSAVREREKRLERQLADAEKSRLEAAALLEEHRQLLAGARAEAQQIVNTAKSVAEHERETLLAKARDEYDGLLARARKEIGDEKAKALVDLRRDAVELSLAVASKLIETKLDAPTNRRIVMDFLDTLGELR